MPSSRSCASDLGASVDGKLTARRRQQGRGDRSDEYAKDPHGPGNVLELAHTFVRETDVELGTQFLAHAAGNADSARLCQRRQPHRYVDGDAPHVWTVGDDIAHIDTHPELGALVQRARIAPEHCSLNIDGAAHRGYHAFEFHERRMAGHSANVAAIFHYPGINQFPPLCHPHGRRASFARHDEPAVADDIGCENGYEPPLYLPAGQTGPPFLRWGGRPMSGYDSELLIDAAKGTSPLH